MKHLAVVIMGHGDAGCSVMSSLYQRPLEAITLVVAAERIAATEIRDLSDLAQIQIIRIKELLDFPFLEEQKVTRWPTDKLLVKRVRPNTKGFVRKGVSRPGRR